MPFKNLLKYFYKFCCCQCASCILWDDFSHIKNWTEEDLKKYREKESELRSK